jgi:hydroxyisourate hydrolase
VPSVDRETLLTCLRVERWADALAGTEFASAELLIEAAMNAATPLSDAEVREALAVHPRIGDQASDGGAQHARAERAASVGDDPEVRRLADADAAYEARFGRVFVIRTKNRTSADILGELERRLDNDPITEFEETAQQLREIAGLRLRTILNAPMEEPRMTPSHVTSQVHDAFSGAPASGISVTLARRAGTGWEDIGWAVTDADGRATSLGPETLPKGVYQVRFDTGTYFAAAGLATFYPEIAVVFELAHGAQHYEVPLVLSPFAYSTYRGS